MTFLYSDELEIVKYEIKKYRELKGLYEVIDYNDADDKFIINAIQNTSLFNCDLKKVFINCEKFIFNKNMERFITNNVEDSSIFIFNCEEKKIPKSLKLMCTVIPNFSIDSARKIIKDILKIHNAQFFDDITMKYFLDLVPKNYFSINSELLKLINFNPIITKENIDKLIFSNEQADIFNFITNLIINDKNKCLSIFENLLSQKYQVTDILVAICPNLLTLKILNSALEKRINSFQIQNSLNIPLWLIKKYEKIMNNQSYVRINKLINNFYVLDCNIKLGIVEQNIGLKTIILTND